MALEPTSKDVVREAGGFVFYMRDSETEPCVPILVADEVLDGDNNQIGADQLRSQFDADRTAIEAVACEKYDHGRVTADGKIIIGLSDIIAFLG